MLMRAMRARYGGTRSYIVAPVTDQSEPQVKLLVTSEVPIYKVFADDPTQTAHEISSHMRSVMDDLVSPSESLDVIADSSLTA